MIEFAANIDTIVSQITAQMSALDIDRMTRLQATTLLAQMRRRIHVDGIATDGSPIGTYSQGYLKYVRPKFGRQEGGKVVLSLTRSMEQGMILIPIPNGTAIGYATPELLQRAKWQEKRKAYGYRAIFSPTDAEKQLVLEIGQNYIKEHFSQ